MKAKVRNVYPKGKDLSRLEKLTKSLEGNSLKLGAEVLRLLHGADHDYCVKAIRVYPNNTKIMVYDEKLRLIGVWERPPGVCRLPRKGEK